MRADPIEAVIFDYGGVLSESPWLRLAAVEASLGLAPGTLPDLLGYGVDVPEPEPGSRSPTSGTCWRSAPSSCPSTSTG